MLTNSMLNSNPKVDYYVTSGKEMGRIVACKKPFYRGKGIYHLSMLAENWEVQGGQTLSLEALEELKISIRNSKAAALKESVRLNAHLGVRLEENPKWVFRLLLDKS